jgi:uncharacterized protein (TIGR02145 family)
MQLKDGGWEVETVKNIFVNTRPQASFTVIMDNDNSLLYHFNASSSSDDEDGKNLQYRWDFDGDGKWDTGWLEKDTTSYKYSVNGDYDVRLSVRDRNAFKNGTNSSINVFDGILTDIDGNVYQTIKIGKQWWMAENLKVAHYCNGDPIPNVTDDSIWTVLSTGAYCLYNNDSTTIAEKFGPLYNWYAVDEIRKIAPIGWHVPTDEEWKKLEIYLGMSQDDADNSGWRGTDEGKKLKATNEWMNDDYETNESGFSALPGGYRENFHGAYLDIGHIGTWWSATESNSAIWSRSLSGSGSNILRYYSYKRTGISVRLVRD